MPVPSEPKIYHIVHYDRLPSIITDGVLWCDAEIVARKPIGTTIGMTKIKERRLKELTLDSHPDLHVGDCVPFYFCPRSVMLYLIHIASSELTYKDGQEHIIHLEIDLNAAIDWADENDLRWAFSLSNAGSYWFEDRCDYKDLNEINWDAVQHNKWGYRGVSPSIKEGKQAEFLVENSFPWSLVSNICVQSRATYNAVEKALLGQDHQPAVKIKREWYY